MDTNESSEPEESSVPLASLEEDSISPVSTATTTSAVVAAEETGMSVYSEEELKLASSATKSFFNKDDPDLASCLQDLRALSLLRPEDPLVTHNLKVLEFSSGNISTKEADRDLKSYYDNIIKDSPEIAEDADNHGVLLYNLGFLSFLQRQYHRAQQFLVKLYEGMNANTDEVLQKRVTNLLCRVYAALGEGEKLQKVISGWNSDNSGGVNPTSILLKAQGFVLTKNVKGFKKDFKDNGVTSDKIGLSHEFFRSNLEYIKGNPRKAQKLLSNAVGEKEVSDEIDSLYHNNLGVVHLMQDKPNLAAYYLKDALDKHIKLFNSESSSDPEYLLRNRTMEITYNLALAYLQSGTQTEISFEYFLKAIPIFQKRPTLWLHLAESCIQSYQRSRDIPSFLECIASFSLNEATRRRATLTSLESGNYQKIVLKDTESTFSSTPKPIANKNINLDFALSCLRNACILIKSQKPVDENILVHVLANHSYACLLNKDYVTAHAKAQELIYLLTNPSSVIRDATIFKLLSHLYAGEALIYLDRISDAITHLGPATLQSFDSDLPSTAEEADDGSLKKNSTYSQLGVSTLNFNLSVAFALRGELDKAQGILDKISGPKSAELATKVTMMNLYINITKKDNKTCKKIISENCEIVKAPTSSAAQAK